MTSEANKIEFLERLLLPLARFCVRKGFAIQHFVRVAKLVFVQAAEAELEASGKKVNVSRVSALSGVTRDDVKKIMKEGKGLPTEPLTLLGRVLAQWEQDSRYQTKRGEPRLLSYRGEESEFHELVSRVSKHLNPGTVLFELERVGSLERRGDKVRRTKALAGADTSPEHVYQFLGSEIDSLITCVDENVWRHKEIGNLHIRTEYDNIFLEDLPEIKRWLIEQGKSFKRKVRDYLSQFDQDISSKRRQGPAGGKVVISVFSMTEGDADPLAEDSAA